MLLMDYGIFKYLKSRRHTDEVGEALGTASPELTDWKSRMD